jgi:hypothetical protein
VQIANLNLPAPVLDIPSVQNFGIADPSGVYTHGVPGPTGDRVLSQHEMPLSPIALATRSAQLIAIAAGDLTPVPSAENFRYARVWKPHSFAHAARKPITQKKHHPAATAAVTTAPPAPRAGSVTRDTAAHAKPKPAGHQLQLSRRPTASLGQQIR